MPYIGPGLNNMQFQPDVFVGNGGNTFNLTYNPGTPNAILVFVSGVLQVPNQAFTLSGKQLIFTGNPGTGSEIIVYYLGIVGDVQVPPPDSVTMDMLTADVTTTLNTKFRNRFVNGNFLLDQRHEGIATTHTGAGTGPQSADQWLVVYQGSATGITFQQVADAPPGFSKSLKITIGTGSASIAAGDFLFIDHNIEGCNCLDFKFGLSSANSISISFWAKSSITGTFSVALQNGSQNRSYLTTFNLTQANLWTLIVLENIPGDITGAWNNTINSTGIVFILALMMGSTRIGTQGWQAGNFLATGAQTSITTTSGATFQMTAAQLEPGAIVTPFEFLPISQQVIICQRYYEKSYDLGALPGTNQPNGLHQVTGTAGGSANQIPGAPFQVPKRTSPSVTCYSRNGTANTVSSTGLVDYGSGISAGQTGVRGFRSLVAPSSIFTTDQYCYHWTADAGL